ncbi:hypothetical protein D3Z52_25260 [Clostridiaceae bacterium]|nr:hypothetical protein [Clostridiaceae bacterium]
MELFQDFKNRFHGFQVLPTMCVSTVGRLKQIDIIPMILSIGTLNLKMHWEIKQFCLLFGAVSITMK